MIARFIDQIKNPQSIIGDIINRVKLITTLERQ